MPEAGMIGSRTFGLCDDDDDCCPHFRGGKCTEGSSDVFINGKGALRSGDAGDCRCPHGGSFELKQGSGSVYINGCKAIRIADPAKCDDCGEAGQVESGSRDVFIGD